MATVLKARVRPDTAYFAFGTTRDPETAMSPVSRWIAQAYDYEDIEASMFSMHIPPGSRVLRVYHEVQTVLVGVVSLVVGDGDTADGWIKTANVTPTTVGDFVNDPDADFAVVGKLYQDGDTIDITFTGNATTDFTSGVGILWVEVISYAEALEAESP